MFHAPLDATSVARRRVRGIGRVVAAALALTLAVAACRQPQDASEDVAAFKPSGARVVGQVKLADGASADGVMAFLSGTRHFSLTDESGRYAIDGVEPGTYRLVARLAGYKPVVLSPALVITPEDLGRDKLVAAQTLPRENAAGKPPAKPTASAKASSATLQMKVSAAGMGTLAGTILAAPLGDDHPSTPTLLTGASVALDGTPYRVATDAKGAFLFWSLPAGAYKLVAGAPEHLSKTVPVTVAAGKQATARVELVPVEATRDATIAGQVLLYDALGQADNQFSKITVRLEGSTLTTGLDSDGAFVLKGLARRRYAVMASGPGFDLKATATADLSQAQAPTTATVTLTLTATTAAAAAPMAAATQATGRVVGSAIKKGPQAGADMSGILVAVAGTQLTAVTDEKGAFTISGVAPGAVRVIATAQGYKRAEASSVQVTAGQDAKLDPLVLMAEHEAPRVIATDPGDDERGVTVRQEFPVTVRFSAKMSPESLRAAARVEPPVAFTTRMGGDSGVDLDVMQILIAGAGVPNAASLQTDYTVTIGTEAADFDGVAMEEPYRFRFRTGGPAVIATRPENGSNKPAMGPREPIVLYFNAKMNPQTLDRAALKIEPKPVAEPLLSVFQDSTTGWSRLNVAAGWEPGMRYTISLSDRARSTEGDSASPYSFSFSTPALIPLNGPQGLPQRPER